MRSSRRYPLFAILTLALAPIAALPARALAAAIDFLDPVFRVDARPFLVRLGLVPTLAIVGDGGSAFVEPALLNEQRHEAGLARLGAVRHR